MTFTGNTKKLGFTLVELLVVIAIVATLAALSFTIGPKILAQGKATKSMENLRQIGPLFAIYASDHSMRLPPARSTTTLPDGSTEYLQWNEVCLAMLFPETDPAEFKTTAWWDRNDTFLRNPLFETGAMPRGWSPLNPGYALNQMIPENLALAATGNVPSHDELLSISVPLSVLADPGRTPLIAPCDNFFFRYDPDELAGFENGTLKDLLSGGKVPIAFVDGHVEAMTPYEYLERKLFLVPIVPSP